MKGAINQFWKIVIVSALISFASACNHFRPCVDLKQFLHFFSMDLIGEPYGATDINAISGNQGLTVAVNQEGTITVFKWPNPSFYDQVKYMTSGREKPRMGALPNEGIFAGIYYQTDSEQGFFWLRDLTHQQSYLGPGSVAVKTRYFHNQLGLEIDQIDLVDSDADVFWRNFEIRKLEGSRVKLARVIVYAHFAPKVSKSERLPLTDWCLDELGNSTLKWNSAKDLFLQEKQGTDLSTKKGSSIALAYGFDRKARSHQAGYDYTCSLKRNPRDPFLRAGEDNPADSDFAKGKVSAGISVDLNFDQAGRAQTSFVISAASEPKQALQLMESSRAKGFSQALAETEKYWRDLLKKVPLPDTDDERIQEVALRSIITILLGYCKDFDAIVASVSTQPPYGEDWPRDGSYINEALLAAGFGDLVRKHNLFYLKVQSQPGNRLRKVPAGNWASNYFADGIPGFPVLWWEIDETGLALWTLYRYYEFSRDREYLEQVYPAIKRAADFFTEFKDPKTGLTRRAYESDETQKFASFRGALSAYLGLNYAVQAAEAMNDEPSREKWSARREELERLIFDRYYDPACNRWVRFEQFRGNCAEPSLGWETAMMFWPADLLALPDPRAEAAARDGWKEIEPSFSGQRERGLYEMYGLLSLAKIWKDQPEQMDLLRKALVWEANVPLTNTGLFGEVWLKIGDQVYAGQSQPQLWQHALFYLAALETFGEKSAQTEK